MGSKQEISPVQQMCTPRFAFPQYILRNRKRIKEKEKQKQKDKETGKYMLKFVFD
jgi:hypothetical protein